MKKERDSDKRSLTGTTGFAGKLSKRIESFISTVVKNDRNVFEQLRQSFDGHNFIMELEAPK